MTIRIFEVNEIEWWAGDFETAKQMMDYLVMEGVCTEGEDEVEMLSDQAVSVMKMSNPKNFDDDGDRIGHDFPPVTFKDQLAKMVEEDPDQFPVFFAGEN